MKDNTKMEKKMRKKPWNWFLWIVVLICLGGGYYLSRTKPVYLEYKTVNDEKEDTFILDDTQQEIVQTFRMPYHILSGVHFFTDDRGKDNNSTWQCTVIEADTQKTVASMTFLGDENGSDFPIPRFSHPVPVKKGAIYELHLRALSVSQQTAPGFFYTKNEGSDGPLTLNGKSVGGQLCFEIYGGDGSFWWLGFSGVLAILLYAFLRRLKRLALERADWRGDRLLCSLALTLLTFLMWSAFSLFEAHTDEIAAMLEGMIVAKGGILYRDCIEQHMPIISYLYGFFTLLGAKNIVQYRLSWYLLISVAWGGLYWRHAERFGKRMFILPLLQALLIPSGILPEGYLLMGDMIFANCIILLFLEFIRYWEDGKLGWGRSVILAISVLGCIGTEFLSLYALFIVFLFGLYREIRYWKQTGLHLRSFLERYYKLVVCIFGPVLIACIYFKANHALRDMYEQVYRFNTEVYPLYCGGLGNNKIAPFLQGIRNCFYFIQVQTERIFSAQSDLAGVLRLAVLLGAGLSLKRLIGQKKYGIAVCLGLCICACAVRLINDQMTVSLHGQPAWHLMVLTNVLFLKPVSAKPEKIAAGLFGIMSLGIYAATFFNLLLQPQPVVNEVEHAVVELTEEGEPVFLDALAVESPYLLYRDRYPVNRLLWMMPWYMDRYEEIAVDDLNEKLPGIVIFDESRPSWIYEHYYSALPDALRKKYTRFSDNEEEGWPYRIWILTNPNG